MGWENASRAPASAAFLKASFTFHVTVVALCHPAVILKLPGGQNKVEVALHGLAGSGGSNVLTSLRERAGAARRVLAAQGLEARRRLGSLAGTALSSQTAPSVWSTALATSRIFGSRLFMADSAKEP